jgi:hypothetical protein
MIGAPATRRPLAHWTFDPAMRGEIRPAVGAGRESRQPTVEGSRHGEHDLFVHRLLPHDWRAYFSLMVRLISVPQLSQT